MTGEEFAALADRYAAGLATGDAAAAAACFAEDVDYADPLRYRFTRRDELHRYHGVAIAEVGPDGLIHGWREWQHVDDARDWARFLAGPAGGGSPQPGSSQTRPMTPSVPSRPEREGPGRD